MVTDSTGCAWQVESVRIFNEGYGTIDVFIDLASDSGDDRLHDDQALVKQIMSRLRSLGYAGPDLGLGADDLQDDRLIVLEASAEEFESFAAAKGWRNLADDYSDDDELFSSGTASAAQAIWSALLQKLRSA